MEASFTIATCRISTTYQKAIPVDSICFLRSDTGNKFLLYIVMFKLSLRKQEPDRI